MLYNNRMVFGGKVKRLKNLIKKEPVKVFVFLSVLFCLSAVNSIADETQKNAEDPLLQIVSMPQRIFPLKRFLLFPVDPEGLPHGIGEALQSELASAFQKRFSGVKDFYLKTLISYPDFTEAHPKNKSFWIRLAKQENVDACIYVRNEGYYQPDLEEQQNPNPLSFKGPQAPSANWRVILLDGVTGEILWNNTWSALVRSKLKFKSEVKDAFPELADMMTRNWPIHPQQWDLKTGPLLGRQFPQEHYGKYHISFSGVYIYVFMPEDLGGIINIIFPEDVKKLGYVISLPTEKTRTLKMEWYGPDKQLMRREKCSSSFGSEIFDALNIGKLEPSAKKGIWEIKVWEKEILLDHQLFLIGETQSVKGSL